MRGARRRRRHPPAGFLSVLVLLASGALLHAQEAGLEVGGSLLGDVSALQTIGEDGGLTLGGYSRLTLNAVNANRRFAKVEGSAVVTLPYGGEVDLELRRLYLSVYTPLFDLSLGRQIINFGVGTLFSPIDAFTAPLLSDLDFTRIGSDVVRLDAQFGEVSGLEAVSTVPAGFDSLTSALKLYTNVAGFDLAAVGLYRGARRAPGARDELIAGADFKGDLLAGIYGEAVVHFRRSPGTAYLEGMLGADYSIGNRLFLTAEYYYNGDPLEPGGASEPAAGAGLFLNRHYLFAGVRWRLTELMSLSASVIYDLSASTVLPTLQYAWNVVQNANVLAYARYFGGDIRSGGAWNGPDLSYGVQVQVLF